MSHRLSLDFEIEIRLKMTRRDCTLETMIEGCTIEDITRYRRARKFQTFAHLDILPGISVVEQKLRGRRCLLYVGLSLLIVISINPSYTLIVLRLGITPETAPHVAMHFLREGAILCSIGSCSEHVRCRAVD